jgi:hypothetical protein
MFVPGRFPSRGTALVELRRRRIHLNRIFPLKRFPSRPQCSIGQTLDLLLGGQPGPAGTGRQIGECEIHIDGNLIFQAFGVLGAGLAYLTYEAIKAKGRRRRRSVSLLDQLERIAIGRVFFSNLL